MPKDPFQVTTPVLNRIVRYNLDRESAASERSPVGSTLFHYTTADGLKGIVEKNELWATSAYYLNDTAEIIYGYGVLAEVLKDWISSCGLPERSLSLGVAKQLQDGFGNQLFNRNIINPIYLACFCEDGNLLSQWRAYGQSGGYSIGFRAFGEGPVLCMKPEPCVYTARWVKVEYERTIQMQRCRTILDSLLPILEEQELTSAIREIDTLSPLDFQGIFSAISEILVEEIVAFKSKAFEVEKEWRIVVRSREMFKQGTDDGGLAPLPIHFRSDRGLLIPYIKLIPSGGKDFPSAHVYKGQLPIYSVRSGPTRDQTIAMMATRMLLDKHGYGAARVNGADISLNV